MRYQSARALRAYRRAAQDTRYAEGTGLLKEEGLKKPLVYLQADNWFPPPVGITTPPVTIRNPDGSVREVVSALAFRQRAHP